MPCEPTLRFRDVRLITMDEARHAKVEIKTDGWAWLARELVDCLCEIAGINDERERFAALALFTHKDGGPFMDAIRLAERAANLPLPIEGHEGADATADMLDGLIREARNLCPPETVDAKLLTAGIDVGCGHA